MKLLSRNKLPKRKMGRPLPDPSRERSPRYPIWKDEKLFGLVSLRACLLVAGLALMSFVVLMCWAFFKISDLTDDVRIQADVNTSALAQIKALQVQRHDQRLADQRRTDIKIRNVACGVLTLFPKGDVNGEKLRDSFTTSGILCPSLGKPFEPVTVPPSEGASKSPSQGGAGSRNQPSVSPTSGQSVAQRPSANRSPKGTVVSRTPGPVQTKTVVRSASASRKPVLPVVPCATVLVITVNCP